MTYLFPIIVSIGLPLVAIPVIIHLIQLRRQRRIAWAAMDFLLQSQKRRRKWILLKQWLLLLSRMAIFAVLALMLAGPVLQSDWGALLGRAETHHVVLLDDSYSMNDRDEEAGTTAFEVAIAVVERILSESRQAGGQNYLTIIPFSQAEALSAGSEPLIYRQLVDEEFITRFDAALNLDSVSQSSAGPLASIRAAARIPKSTADEQRLFYLVSDFRERQWKEPAGLKEAIDNLQAEAAPLHLVHCAREEHSNLAIQALEFTQGVPAEGVETWLDVTVANFSPEAKSGVTLQLEQDGENRGAIELENIPAYGELSHRIRVQFQQAGGHNLVASLPADSVPDDNQRFVACAVPPAYRVLIIDGSADGSDGYFLNAALAPGGASTGWQARIEGPAFLRDHDLLAEFACVFVLDVASLDDAEISALEEYVSRGGGLGWFVGPQTKSQFINDKLYNAGGGLLPVPLDVPHQLLPEPRRDVPDLKVSNHPIMQVFAGERNSFVDLVLMEYFYGIAADWTPEESTQILAQVRTGAPLIVEKPYGMGRVVTFLSKLSAEQTPLGRWSNWSLNPVFPVLALETAAYLSEPTRQAIEKNVGDALSLSFEAGEYTPEAQAEWLYGGAGASETVSAQSVEEHFQFALGKAAEQGILRWELETPDGATRENLMAINVESSEGDLRTLGENALNTSLEGVQFRFSWADSFARQRNDLAGIPIADSLFYSLLAFLIVEQLLAYFASYHPRTKVATA